MKFKSFYIAVFFAVIFSGCINPPSYPDEPEITFVSVSRSSIEQLDAISIIFEFTDGDGDLGFTDLDATSCDVCACETCDSSCVTHPTNTLFVTDSRTNCLSIFHLPNIPPKGSSDAISGKIDVLISSICCVFDDNTACRISNEDSIDSVFYTIMIKDRSGNLSNQIITPKIYIDCTVL